MEADTGQPRPPEQRLHVEVGRAGVDRILRLHRVGEYPLADGIVSVGSSRPRFVGSNEPLFVGKPEANR